VDDPREALGPEIERLAEKLWDVSLELHGNPELAFEEHGAAARLTAELETRGFDVRRGVAGLPTAFTARAGSGDGPTVALLLEYDALPGLGHACGHNLIAAAGLGAALAVHRLLPELPGTLLVVGTPAEEGGGGKIIELGAGVFDGVDAALMFHPGVHTWEWAPLTAQVELHVTFHGRAAHPTGDPVNGIDALAALIELFNTLGGLHRRLPPGSHVQGIITEGGSATNIVPERAEGRFGLRGLTTNARENLVAQVTTAAEGVATATGTTVKVERPGAGYAHFRNNDVVSGLFSRHLTELGFTITPPEPGVYLGSSDIGDVSTTVPAIHPFVAITCPEHSDHTPVFAAAAASPRGREVMLAATEALARTTVDLLSRPALVTQAWEHFHHQARSEGHAGPGPGLALS
jgi:amidohydrolase